MAGDEDDFIMISALQHYQYCPRQFALIHLEQFWQENFFTRDGKHLHERVELPGSHRSAGRRVEYALPLANHELGIAGVADAVEFLSRKDGSAVAPVEYKRGEAKEDDCDRIQLCAQVFCLEEMMKISIDRAWLFYFETRSRLEVEITPELRAECRAVIAGCREIFDSGRTPLAIRSAKCRGCSLADYCMAPEALRSCLADFAEMMR